MKLALGTVQFGLDYGIANRYGQVPVDEAEAILACARSAGIDTLDTAMTYGESEQRLGRIGIAGWRVVTKLPAVPDGCADVSGWIRTSVRGALARLGISTLSGLLLHKPQQLLGPEGGSIVRALDQVKAEGLVEKTGISIYEPAELDALAGRYHFDLVQAPFNLLDRRLIATGWMAKLAAQGTELHVRSIFLQGLLLMGRGSRPAAFDRWASMWTAFDAWLVREGITPVEACVRDALSFPSIARVIVGVERVQQLTEVIRASGGPAPEVPAILSTDDTDLLNPARWQASA